MQLRLIPAGAGQMPPTVPSACAQWAHPRRCGADFSTCSRSPLTEGSSPQVRGRLSLLFQYSSSTGLIPAGAGQIAPSANGHNKTRAHPRRCGADPYHSGVPGAGGGSSPQVRGRSRRAGCTDNPPRLIPAGAGQIAWSHSTAIRGGAHPRRCGADTGR